MSICVYYRKNKCWNLEKCQYKLFKKDGKRLCQVFGELPDMNKSSEDYRKEKE